MSSRDWPEKDRAYNGQQESPKRDLTPRERDVLCRMINLVSTDPRYTHEEIDTLKEVYVIINPRTEDEDALAFVANDVIAGIPGTLLEDFVEVGPPEAPGPSRYCRNCIYSGVGACDDFPNCPAGRP
jgi:hypothetical protein